MLDFKAARKVVEKNLPDGKIKSAILHNGMYIFMVFFGDDENDQFDPFYSVDSKNGEFRDFSIITDGDTSAMMKKFALNNLVEK